MAKVTKKGQKASLLMEDAIEVGSFAGGPTTIKSHRFGMGYPKQDGTVSNPEAITLRITHRPKGEDETRTEILNMGKSAPKHWTIGGNGKYLKAKTGAAVLDSRSKGMMYLGTLHEAGVPAHIISGGDMSAMDGLKIVAEMRPLKYDGLIGEDGKPVVSTLFACQKVMGPLPWEGDNDEEDDEGGGDDSDDEDETDSGSGEEDEDEEEDSSNEEEDDESDSGDDDDDDDEEDVPLKTLDKALLDTLNANGGSLKRTQLSRKAMAALKAHPKRNAIVPRLVEPRFLKRGKGWTFNQTSGTVSLA